MFFQIGPSGGAKALAAPGPNLVRMFLRFSSISVPNFTTVSQQKGFLAATDSLARRGRRSSRIIIIRKVE